MSLFSTDGFLTRRQCGDWPWSLIWTHAIADLGIFVAYMILSLLCAAQALKASEYPWRRLLSLGFGVFISACGFTHLMDAATFIWPAYRLEALVKVYTAVVSLATAIGFLIVWPRVQRAPTARDVDEAGLDLDSAYKEFSTKLDTATSRQDAEFQKLREAVTRLLKLSKKAHRGN